MELLLVDAQPHQLSFLKESLIVKIMKVKGVLQATCFSQSLASYIENDVFLKFVKPKLMVAKYTYIAS